MSHFAFVESLKGRADRQYHRVERKHLSIPAPLPVSTCVMPNREITYAVYSGVLWKKKCLIITTFVAVQGIESNKLM